MKQDLRTQGSYRQILQLAGPISLALFVPQINFITTNIFLGHLSEGALARASIAGVYYLVFAALGIGLNNGLQAIISRRAGERSHRSIGLYFDQAILLSLVMALAAILFTWSFAPMLLKAFLSDQQIAADTAGFLRIRILGLPFLFVYQMRNALLIGIHRSRLLIVGTIAEALTNVLFDYLLIFGHGGFPALGFKGAAIASIIAEFSGMFLVFVAVSLTGIQRDFGLFKSFRPRRAVIRHIWRVSSPLIMQTLISLFSWLIFYVLIEPYGPQALAISQVMRNVIGFFSIAIWSLGASTNSMVSNLIGQKRYDDVLPTMNRILRLSLSVSFLVALFLNLFPQWFLGSFSNDASFVSHGIPSLRVVSLAMVIMAAGAVGLNAVTGTGYTRVSFRIEMAAVAAYLTYIFITLKWLRLGITVGWMSELVYWSILFALSLAYLRANNWRNKRI